MDPETEPTEHLKLSLIQAGKSADIEEIIPVIQSVLALRVAVELTTVVPVYAALAQILVAAAANRSKVSSSESVLGLHNDKEKPMRRRREKVRKCGTDIVKAN